ncbi:Bromodomain-containing protein [Panaeolus papilionaceus]|nr:Bromodomain-containing protein [Panaeolus papilionaceus]
MSYANLESTLSINQYRFCLSTIRSLKKSKDAAPFLRPVDPVALNIPHYPSIIKTPMDVSTIERKLASSNPAKPDPNDYNPRYLNADEFSGDVRQIYNNTATFNGPEHVITAMGKRMLELFEKMMKNMPANEKIEKIATPPPPPPPVVAPPPKKLPPAARRASTSVPVIRRSDRPEAEPASAARPKREIHPPPPKDLPYQDLPKKRKHKKTQDDGTAEQLKYCNKILQEMHKKQHWTIANPFYEPVDWQKLDIPMYPKIIKKPMDLSTMRRRLDAGHYETAQGFYDDFKLMIRNCFTFNPPGSPVNSAGQDLQRLFDEKWKGLPPLITHEPSEDEEDEEDDSEVERQRAIAQMESQIESMRDKLTQLKNKAPKEKKKKEKKEKAPVASTSKPPPKPPKAAPAPPPKKKSKKPIADDDVLTFDQKKDLSEAIGRLEGAPLERVIQIIHEGVPEIRDSTEEIELEIDLLPAAVLTKLYNYVIRPIKQQQAAPKRNRTGKGTGTGGLKRKSMDEEKEAEKIRQLEERMALFDRGADASGHSASARRHHDSEHSSDSSSGSDSSGSDSE